MGSAAGPPAPRQHEHGHGRDFARTQTPGADSQEMQRSVTDAATRRIRQEILSGRIRPGERMRLNTLKQLLGISHIPVREALRRLEGEGLVENIPRRGAVATPLSLVEFGHLYDLRKIIEPAIAARSLPVASERLGELEAALRAMKAVKAGWSSPEFPELHRRFHWLILEAGANKVVEQTIRHLWQLSQRYVVFAMTLGTGAPMVARDHMHLLTVAAQGDGEVMARELLAHLEHTESGMREALRLAAENASAG